MRLITLTILIVCVPSVSLGQKWCFVVAGDGRADPAKNRAMDKDGVNTVITSEIAQAVLKENAKMLLWTGDLVFGSIEDAKHEQQLLSWKNIMKPLYEQEIPVLAVRGNHELRNAHSEEIWNRVFTGPYAMPQNGPLSERNLTHYYGKDSVLVIGLDQYRMGKETVNQPWLDGVLAQHPKPFIFAFGHEPAFMDGHHKDTLDAHPANRDAMWNSLIGAGSQVFFAGHDHFYDHMVVTREGSNPGPEVHQIVAGTAGAPFYATGPYSGVNTGWTLKRIASIGDTYGYVLVEIEGNTATITFKGRKAPGQYVSMDSFTIKGTP